MRMRGLQEGDAVDGNGVSQSVSGGTFTPSAESSQGASGHSARESGASSIVALTRVAQEGSWAVGLQVVVLTAFSFGEFFLFVFLTLEISISLANGYISKPPGPEAL